MNTGPSIINTFIFVEITKVILMDREMNSTITKVNSVIIEVNSIDTQMNSTNASILG